MSRLSRTLFFGLGYYSSWLLFGAVGLMLNLVCAALLPFPKRKATAARTRAAIQGLFSFYTRWLHFTGVVRITWEGFDRPLTTGTVYVANHPTLTDAPIALSRIPDAICIFKPQLMRNPALGPAALMAEYVAGDAGVDLIRTTASRIAEGRSLLIFPEGTRTEMGKTLGQLRSGFALIASRARAPVQLLVIRATPEICRKGRAWWRLPRVLPAHFIISLDQRWEHDPTRHAAGLTAEVAVRLAEVAGEPVEAPHPFWKWKR